MQHKNLAFLAVLVMLIVQTNLVTAAQPFNLAIDLPDTYKNVHPGGEIWFTIKLLNLDNQKRIDIVLNYDIIDKNGGIKAHSSKTVAIETQASFVADLQIPEEIPPGEYTIRVTVESNLGNSEANTSITISNPETDYTVYYIALGIVGLIIIILLIIKSKTVFERFKLRTRIADIVRRRLKKR